MPRLAALLLALLCACASPAQSGAYASRAEALKALSAPEPERRAEAVAWVAEHGTQADGEALSRRLSDENPVVRGLAEQGLWILWHRSGDKAIEYWRRALEANPNMGGLEMNIKGAEQLLAEKRGKMI